MDLFKNVDVGSIINGDNSPQMCLENDNTPNLSFEIMAKLPRSRLRLKEKSRLLPERAVVIMNEWYKRNYANPYPTYREVELMAQRGSISIAQVKQWFVNIRRRTGNQFRKKREIRVGVDSTLANDDSTDDIANQSTTSNTAAALYYHDTNSTSTPSSSSSSTSMVQSYANYYTNYYNYYASSPSAASQYYPHSSPVNPFYAYYNHSLASYYSPTNSSPSSPSIDSSTSSLNDSTANNQSTTPNSSTSTYSHGNFYPPYFNY